MNEFQIVKLVIDTLLVGSLLFLCVRFARGSSSHLGGRVTGLESSLRLLIEDADNAGQALNEKLLKRKASLEKLLFELETVEQRTTRVMNSAEGVKTELEMEITKAQQGRLGTVELVSAVKPKPVEAQSIEDEPALDFRVPAAEAPKALARENRRPPATPALPVKEAAIPAEAQQPEQQSPRQWGKVNIYGEPIGAAPAQEPQPAAKAAPRNAYKPLAASVEKERRNAYSDDRAGSTDLQRVYDAAENLLRTGQSVQTVCSTTQLPLDEVKLLAQMVQQEEVAKTEAEAAVDDRDRRLGVLGAITRRTQVL